jgi:isopenicillin-N N-acyltransferase-like protein
MNIFNRFRHDTPMLAAAGLLAVILIGAGCGTIARQSVMNHPKVKGMLEEPVMDRTVSQRGHLDSIGQGEDRITVLYVSGTPYEMGYEHGRSLGPEVRQTIEGVMAGLYKFLPKQIRASRWLTERDKHAIINAVLDRGWEKLAPFTPPQDLEEMAGLADGSGVPLQLIHRMHAVPDLTETSCSALWARDSATVGGRIYQLRILDYGAEFSLFERPLITVYRPTGANAFVNVGWIGFVGVVSGINDKNVALSEIGHGDPPGETLHGIPMPFLMKNVLRHADDAGQAAAIVRAAPRTNSYIYFFGDRHGGAVGMITSRQQVAIYHPNQQPFIEEKGRHYRQFTDVLYAGHYQDAQADLIERMHGAFDIPAIRDLARQIATRSNLHTVIYDLTGSRIWVANRTRAQRAADRPYVEFDLAAAWTSHPAALAGHAAGR